MVEKAWHATPFFVPNYRALAPFATPCYPVPMNNEQYLDDALDAGVASWNIGVRAAIFAAGLGVLIPLYLAYGSLSLFWFAALLVFGLSLFSLGLLSLITYSAMVWSLWHDVAEIEEEPPSSAEGPRTKTITMTNGREIPVNPS